MSALSTKQTPPATRIAISTEGQRPLDLTVTPELLELVDLTTLINRGTSERFNLSFSALLLAFYYGRHGISDWFRQYISEQGADLDAILNYRQLKAEEIQRRIRENDLPFPDPDKEYQQGGRTATSSAHKWLTTAKDLSEQQRHTRTGLRHAMSAVIFTPGFHDEDLNRWRFDRRRWAASYVEYVAQYLPNDLDFLRRLRDRTFPGDSAPSSVPETTSASELLSSVNASAVSRQARQPTDQSVRTAVPSSVPSDLNEKAGSDPSEPPSSAQNLFVTGTPGYTSEFCGLGGNGAVTDSLKVEDLAHRFAELIVLRETKLPLAIGLFGNWGSGKSHFMNLIDRDIKALADRELNPPLAANPGDHAEDPWCREMVPIYFNAWHYSDANLWASLVAEVFDALFARLDRKPDQLGYLQARLQEAGGVTALASEEATQASKVVAQADKALQAARSDSERTGKKVLAFKTGLATLLPELITGQNRQQLVELLGIAPEIATLSQLELKRSQLTSISGQLEALWGRALAREGRRARLSWLAGALVALALSYLANQYLRQHAAWIAGMGPWVRGALISVAAFLGWLAPVFKRVQSGLTQLKDWQTRAEAAQAKMPKDPRLIQAQKAKSSADARAVAAEAALAAAQSLEMQLTQSIEDLSPQRRLTRFIEARARSADYRGQLGLVSLARRDFTELSRIFADSEALNKRAQERPDQAEKLRTLNSSVDRVVLFIDDLDRCDPEKVVDVLQAVHLLLAYPLFVVVVGVDQRCLRQSLRMRFKGLLTSADSADVELGKRTTEEGEIPATPLDYLEKIFHIPFHLPAMNKDGFENLVENLTVPTVSAAISTSGLKESVPAGTTAQSGINESAGGAGGTSRPKPPDAAAGPDFRSQTEKAHDSSARESVRAIGSVPLERWERNALKDYSSLIRSPRGVIRLLNTYRLVRAGIPVEEWGAFRGLSDGHGESNLAMLLLAVAAGEPSVARNWFKRLRVTSPGETPLSNEVGENARPEWNDFCRLYKEALEKTPVSLMPGLVTKWLDRVERFTF